MRSLVFAVAAVTLFLSAGRVEAQALDPLTATLIDSATVRFEAQGFTREGRIRSGRLINGAEDLITLELRGGFNYAIMGVCDGNCVDLDLVLTHADGTRVDADFEADDVAIVGADVIRDSVFRVTVSMAMCSGVERCGYSVAVFSTPQ